MPVGRLFLVLGDVFGLLYVLVILVDDGVSGLYAVMAFIESMMLSIHEAEASISKWLEQSGVMWSWATISHCHSSGIPFRNLVLNDAWSGGVTMPVVASRSSV